MTKRERALLSELKAQTRNLVFWHHMAMTNNPLSLDECERLAKDEVKNILNTLPRTKRKSK